MGGVGGGGDRGGKGNRRDWKSYAHHRICVCGRARASAAGVRGVGRKVWVVRFWVLVRVSVDARAHARKGVGVGCL